MKKYIYILAITLSLQACDFLNVEHIGKSDIPTFYSDINSLEPALNGMYQLMNSYYESYMLIYPEVTGDLMYLHAGNTEWERQYNFTSKYEDETTAVGYIWKNGYNIILNANYLIAYAPNLKGENDKNDAIVENSMAQAYFIRALMHFELCRTYAQTYTYTDDASHIGVPVMRYIPDILEKMTRSSVKDVYKAVIEDLNKALETFRDDYKFDEYRATPDACKALLARVYLYMEDYENAKLYSEELMAKYPLTSRDKYRDMFTSINVRGGEDIFRINNYDNSSSLSKFYKYDNPQARPSEKLKAHFTDSRDVRLSMFEIVKYSEIEGKEITYTNVNAKYYCADEISDKDKHYDPHIFRGSEMYLIHAEACCKTGQYAQAEADIKQLQARALGVSASSISLNYNGEDQLMDIIEEERIKELFFEGHRLYDLTRWHKGLARDEQSTSEIRNIAYPDYRFVLPVPLIEMESNDQMIQNPTSN